MYGKIRYGLVQYAQESEDIRPTEEFFVDLARYAPPFLSELLELKELYRRRDTKLDIFRIILEICLTSVLL